MNSWRVTKYNPKFRDQTGNYTRADEEWYLYSQIGSIYNGVKFSYNDYKKVEDAYVKAILYFMRDARLTMLQVVELDKPKKKLAITKHYSKKMIQAVNSIKEGELVDITAIAYIARWNLRDMNVPYRCILQSKDMFVHFGWDYYMYIGSTYECKNAIVQIEELGLFVEPMKSPYFDKYGIFVGNSFED
jgi:hypothetical protein